MSDASSTRTPVVASTEELVAFAERLGGFGQNLQAILGRLERAEAALARYTWAGTEGLPEKWDTRRTVDVHRGAQAVFSLAEVVDPATKGMALRNAQRIATTHPVTGLMDRRGLKAYVTGFARTHVASAKEPATLTVVSLDLINFKRINDDYAQKTGDQVLRLYGHAFEQALRGLGMDRRENGEFRIAHTGGDEFYIVGKRPLSETQRKDFFQAVTQNFGVAMAALPGSAEATNLVLNHNKVEGRTLDTETFGFRYAQVDQAFGPALGAPRRGHSAPDIKFTSGEMVAQFEAMMVTASFEADRIKEIAHRKVAIREAQSSAERVEVPPKFVDRRSPEIPEWMPGDEQRHNVVASNIVTIHGNPKDLTFSERTFGSSEALAAHSTGSVAELGLTQVATRGPSSDGPELGRRL